MTIASATVSTIGGLFLSWFHDQRQPLLTQDAHGCATVKWPFIGRFGRPLLSPSIDGAQRRQRPAHFAHRVGRQTGTDEALRRRHVARSYRGPDDQAHEQGRQQGHRQDHGQRDADVWCARQGRLRVQRGGAQRKAHDAADREQAMTGHGWLEHEQHDPDTDEHQPTDVHRQAAEADHRQDDGDRTQDARHEVGVLELEQQAVDTHREEDERDVRVGQEAQQVLLHVHWQARRDRVGQRQGDGLTLHDHAAAVGESEDLIKRPGDAVDATCGECFGAGIRLGVDDGRVRPVGVARRP